MSTMIERIAKAMYDGKWDAADGLLEKLIVDAYVRGVEWNEENPLDREYRFKAALDYADKALSGDA